MTSESPFFDKKWDPRFIELAKLVASWSKDPSTKTGAVIVAPDHTVISTGFNGFPRGMSDAPELYNDKTQKYSRIIHCEMNAILFAKEIPAGSTLYTYPCISCDRCMVHMLQVGIRRFVAPRPTTDMNSRWAEAFEQTRKYAEELRSIMIEV